MRSRPALLGAPALPPATDSVVEVARHFGGINIDLTRTVERRFMGVKLDVVVAGRAGQERLWNVPSRVLPANAPVGELTPAEYKEARVMRAMRRLGNGRGRAARVRAQRLML